MGRNGLRPFRQPAHRPFRSRGEKAWLFPAKSRPVQRAALSADTPEAHSSAAGERRGFRPRGKPLGAVASVIHQEAAQLLAAARVAELAQRLGLDLTDAFARDVELLADFLESVVGVHVDAE